MSKRPRQGGRSRSRTKIFLACGHPSTVWTSDIPMIATVSPAVARTIWDKLRRRTPRPVIASRGHFVTCQECGESQPRMI